MKLGIASPSDISCFVSYFKEQNSINIIKQNSQLNSAPAVNTLILSFLKEGHYIRLFTLSNNSFHIRGNNIDIYGIEYHKKYPSKYLWGDFINAKNIKQIITKNIFGLDVLHAHWTYSYAYASSFFTDKLPVFCTVRDWANYIWKIESNKNKITWGFKVIMNELVFHKKQINFIANSIYTASLIKKKYNIFTPVIPNPIKQSFLRNEEHISPRNLEILCISSSNDKRKNIITLLLAFKILLETYPDAHLSLIGPPFTEKEPLIRIWRKKGLLEQVTLLGTVNHDKLIEYLDKSRMFISPSLEETFGNTILESISRKIPVIAGKNSGAIPYILQNGNAGFLCDVSDIYKLIETIGYVYTHLDLANEKAIYAYKLIENEYSSRLICEKHITLYNNILS